VAAHPRESVTVMSRQMGPLGRPQGKIVANKLSDKSLVKRDSHIALSKHVSGKFASPQLCIPMNSAPAKACHGLGNIHLFTTVI